MRLKIKFKYNIISTYTKTLYIVNNKLGDLHALLYGIQSSTTLRDRLTIFIQKTFQYYDSSLYIGHLRKS